MELTKTNGKSAADRLRELAGELCYGVNAPVGNSLAGTTSEWDGAHPGEAAMTWPELLRDIADQAEREAAGVGEAERRVLEMWPRFEDGELVCFGDRFVITDLTSGPVSIVEIDKDGWFQLTSDINGQFHYGSFHAPGRPVMRSSEPDSWERIEAEAFDKLMPNDAEVALDLVRRARALAEGGAR